MPRFTISHHTGSREGDHYDFMLEHGEALRTWRLRSTTFHAPQNAQRLKDHRKDYLDYEGEVSGGRGRVRIWDTGTYLVDEERPDLLRIALAGRQLRTRLNLQRPAAPPDKPEPPWTVVDATLEVRRLAATLLRGQALEEAPTAELDALRSGLLLAEQKILAQVDRYARGGPVDWPVVETDAELSRQIDSQKARWQHPWLSAAKKYADRLTELTRILQQQRPA